MAIHAMNVEHKFTNTKCGLMDQLAVSLAEKGKFVEIDFRPFAAGGIPRINLIEQNEIFQNYSLVAIDTKVKHKLSKSPYGERRQSCEDALNHLNDYFGENFKSLSEFNEYPPLMDMVYKKRGGEGAGDAQEYIFDILQNDLLKDFDVSLSKRTAHVLCENVRVSLATTALKGGNKVLMAKQINRSHASLRDFFEVSCVELDEIREETLEVLETLGHERNIIHPVLGSRMTGGGFGGSTIQWVHNDLVVDFQNYFEKGNSNYEKKYKLQPKIILASPSNGITISEIG